MKKLLSTIFLSLVVSLFTTSLKADGHDFTIFNNSGLLQFDGGGSDPEVLSRVEEHVVKLSGVRPKVIVPSMQDSTEQLNLLLASDTPPDLFQANWDKYSSTLMPLNDLLAKHGEGIMNSVPASSWQYMTDPDGNIMGIPRTAATSPFITWVRQDILDQAGLSMPKTIDDLSAYMAAAQKINPDYKAGTISWWWNGWEQPAYAFGAGFTGGMSENGAFIDATDGRVKPFPLMDGVTDYLHFMNDWHNKGYWYPDNWSKFAEPEVLRTCNIAMWSGWYSRMTIIVPKVESNCPGMKYVRTSIIGPKGYIATTRPGGTNSYVINKKAKNPEAIMKYLNWMWNDKSIEGYATGVNGIEGEHWSYETKGIPGVVNTKDKAETKYVGDFGLPLFPYEGNMQPNDSLWAKHFNYLGAELTYLDDSTLPFDLYMAWDKGRIADEVPSLGDIHRMIAENFTAFYTGERSIDEYDAFLSELDDAGMQDWINAMTRQMQESWN
tara:strand:+ start:518 stop:1996 length:1479 start_codon:yes stop_codon:yes gene_type:complete